MLKLILATVVVALSWIAVLLLRLPEIISVAITVIVIISLLTVYSVARYRARRAARQLERELSAQSDAHASRVRPELEGDIRKLQGEFERAIGALKASKV